MRSKHQPLPLSDHFLTLRDQLLEAGLSREEADGNAYLWQKRAEASITLWNRENPSAPMTVEQWVERYPVSVVRELSPAALAQRARFERQRRADRQQLSQFAGAGARTANHAMLAQAKEQVAAGVNAEQVRQLTGWHQGVDGHWRFEIDDGQAFLDAGGKRPFSEWMAQWGSSDLRLGDLLKHPALYEAYPQLAEVHVDVDFGRATGASVQGSDGVYHLMIGHQETVRDLLPLVLHEAQHVIQELEGFASGGDPRMAFADGRLVPGASKAALKAAHAILAELLEDLSRPMSLADYAQQAWGRPESDPEVQADYSRYVASLTRTSPVVSHSAQEAAAREWYKRLAGEVEARNTANRSRLNAEQRRQSPPAATADVPAEKQVINFARTRAMDLGDARFAERTLSRAAARGADSHDLMVYVSPEWFLNLTEPRSGQAARVLKVEEALARGERLRDLPCLEIRFEGEEARICGHEGRHRVAALQAEGLELIPVVLYGKNVRWGATQDIDWPETLVGETGEAVPFPVQRHAWQQSPESRTANHATRAEALKHWFGNSLVVVKDGQPLRVYRGEHGELDGHQEYQTKLGSLTFGSANAANTYAMESNERWKDPEAPRVMPAYLRIEKPVFVNEMDCFIELSDLEKTLGTEEALRIGKKFAQWIESTGNWQDGYHEFASPVEFLDKHPERLGELYFDAYHLLDDLEEVERFKAAGFDGAMHMGNGETFGEMEYRVFDESQIISAIEFAPEVEIEPTLAARAAAFARWFGDSQLRNLDGTPMTLYHGTGSDFDTFSHAMRGSQTSAADAKEGFFFTDSPQAAAEFAWKDGERGHIMPVHLRMTNPYIAEMTVTPANQREFAQVIQEAKAAGHDGVAAWLDTFGHVSAAFVVFESNQIKSAIGNDGTYDLDDDSILSQTVPQAAGREATPERSAATGVPMSLYFARNTASGSHLAPADMDFGQAVEPAGEYMVVDTRDLSANQIPGWVYGQIHFDNPLVLEHKSTTSTGWKKDLSEQFGGKTGADLAAAVTAAGHDGIVTLDQYGYNEVVNLSGTKGAWPEAGLSPAAAREANFRRWFGASMMVDADGQPLPVYHGTAASLERFEASRAGQSTGHASAPLGFFFTKSALLASNYAEMAAFAGGITGAAEPAANVLPVYLRLENPKVFATSYEFYRLVEAEGFDAAAYREQLVAEGYDGLLVSGGEEIVVFSPGQIKSAVGNDGSFDLDDASILSQTVPQAPGREANFASWFAGSKVVNGRGEPLVVYHGTDEAFTAFNTDGEGAFFTTNREAAEDYGDRVVAVYLSLQNPYRVTERQWGEGEGLSPEEARAAGNDGYIILDHDVGGEERSADEIFSTVGDTYIAFYPEQIKAVDNDGSFDRDDPSILSQFAGRRAKTADKTALLDAISMLADGDDPELVRQQTGWHLGRDNQMRFEIDDSAAEMILWGEPSIQDLRDANDGEWITSEDFAEKYPGHDLTAQTQKWADIRRMKSFGNGMGVSAGVLTLGDLVRHDALFKAYPWLAEVGVMISDTMQVGTAIYREDEYGYFRNIVMGPIASPDEALRILMHEAQHAIQRHEGYARGGMPEHEGVRVALREGRAHNSTPEEIKTLRKELEQLRREYSRKSGMKRYKGQAAELRQIIARDAELERLIEDLSTPTVSRADAYDAYRRLAGEVEARNTEKRLKFSAEVRRETPPQVTEDVNADKVVVLEPSVAVDAEHVSGRAGAGAAPQSIFDWSIDSPRWREARVGGTRIIYSFDGERVEVASLRTPQAKRGKGSARRAMEALLAEADARGVPVKLGSSPLDARTHAGKLEAFYASLGFERTGKAYNPAGDPEMQREPRLAPVNEAFRAWFRDSQIVDAAGAPKAVFHGTRQGGFDAFRPNHRKGEQLGFGIHFAESEDFARRYAEDDRVARRGKQPEVYAVHLSMQNPLRANTLVREGSAEFALGLRLAGKKVHIDRDAEGVRCMWLQSAIDATSGPRAERLIREAGYDGVIYDARVGSYGVVNHTLDKSESYIVFEPSQVKSALGNDGSYDLDDASILSQSAALPSGLADGPLLEVDNTGGDWLAEQQQRNEAMGFNRYGAPHSFGQVTARWSRQTLVPVSVLKHLKGLYGEQQNVRQNDLDSLLDYMGANRRLPPEPYGEDDRHAAPYIEVWQDGSAWINEGNHRIMSAALLDAAYLPVDIRYFAGAEAAEGPLSPAAVQQYDAEARAAGLSPTRYFAPAPAPLAEALKGSERSERLRAWLGDSQLIDANGNPLLLFHGTGREFDRFDRSQVGSGADAGNATTGAIWLTDQPAVADFFAGMHNEPALMPLHARMVNPLVVDCAAYARRYLSANAAMQMDDGSLIYDINPFKDAALRDAKAGGHDGLIFDGGYDEIPRPGRIFAVFQPDQLKSALGNDGSFDREDDSILSQFVGEHARTANQVALTAAKESLAAGADAEDVRRETGWFQGTDGFWRFEIDDSLAELTIEDPACPVERLAFNDTQAGLSAVKYSGRLGDMLWHERLYAAYPQLIGIQAVFTLGAGQPSAGSFSPGMNMLRASGRTEADLLATVTHELQHAVQELEGFAAGGNPAFLHALNEANPEFKEALNRWNEVLILAGWNSNDLIPPTDDALRGYDPIDDLFEDLRIQMGKHWHAQTQRRFAGGDEVIEKFEEIFGPLDSLDSWHVFPNEWDQYRRLAGEVEARNAARRRLFTDEERQARSPESTADVAPSQQLVLWHGRGMDSHAIQLAASQAEQGPCQVQVVSEARGKLYGPKDGTLRLLVDGEELGTLDYSDFDGQLFVNMISVAPHARRRGYGRQMMLALQSQHPNTEIQWGVLTQAGAALIASLPTEQVASEHTPAFAELEELRTDLGTREAVIRDYRATAMPTPDQSADFHIACDGLNDLRERIGKLEFALQDCKPTRTLLVTDAPEGLVRLSQFAGAKAQTADLARLAQAQAAVAAGMDPQQVRRESGWHQGLDKQWRFEIDDSGAFIGSQLLQRQHLAGRELKRATVAFNAAADELRAQLLRGEITSERAEALFAEARKTLAEVRRPLDPILAIDPGAMRGIALNAGRRLSEVLYHPALFAAYPELAQIEVRGMQITPGDETYGYFDGKTLHVRAEGMTVDAQLEVIIHELQHAIQRIEGFAPGGMVEHFRDISLVETQTRPINQRLHALLESDADFGRMKRQQHRTFSALYSAYAVETPSGRDLDWGRVPEVDREAYFDLCTLLENYEQFWEYTDLEDTRARIERESPVLTAFEQYQRLAGEVEARNTVARLRMGAAARRMAAPELTEDVARDLQRLDIPGRRPYAAAAVGTAGGVHVPLQRRLPLGWRDEPTTPTESLAFKDWFRASKATDKAGRPLMLFHGTRHDFDAFGAEQARQNGRVRVPDSTYFFSSSPAVASTYAGQREDMTGRMQQGEGGNVMPVYLSLQKPLVINARGANWDDIYWNNEDWSTNDLAEHARQAGYDGLIIRNVKDVGAGAGQVADNYVVFSPEQIKSALGNDGSFDRDDASILSQTVAGVRPAIKTRIVDAEQRPLTVYHGTNALFSRFEKPELNRMAMRASVGHWFTSSKADAATYGSRVIEAQLAITNPRRITRKQLDELSVSYPHEELMRRLSANGRYDGLIIETIKPDPIIEDPGMPEQYVVFSADQIHVLDAGLPELTALDDLPPVVQEDIETAILVHWDHALKAYRDTYGQPPLDGDLRGELFGLVEPMGVPVTRMAIEQIDFGDREVSERAVESYRQLLEDGSEAPPVLVRRVGERYVLVEGGHRFAAAHAAGASTIAVADVTALHDMDWASYFAGEPEVEGAPFMHLTGGQVLSQFAGEVFRPTLGADGQPLVVYHGTTETVMVPGERVAGDQQITEAARSGLQALAEQHGIADWSSVPGILERWERYGQAEGRGVTPEIVRQARAWKDAFDASAGYDLPSVERLAFDRFRMPEGDTELGVHLGDKAAASMYGTPFPMHISLHNPIRLPDLGNWKPVAVIGALRRAGVSVSADEAQAVLTAPDQNTALRALFQAKGFDGVVYRNEAEGFADSYIVLDPEQIRPVDPDAQALSQFAGVNAQSADRSRLAQAIAAIAAGEDAEAVRQQTGWQQGADGLWRFEIDDSAAAFTGAYYDLITGRRQAVALGALLDHPALFEAYPDLRHVEVGLQYMGRASGAVSDTGKILLNPQMDAPRGAVSFMETLMHEVQHLIQQVESFAVGGSPNDKTLPTRDALGHAINAEYSARTVVIQQSEAYQAFVQAELAKFPEDQRYRPGRKGLYDYGLSQAEEAAWHQFIGPIDAERLARLDELFALEGLFPRGNEIAYRLLAGEAEARNAAARLEMTAEQRRATAPGATLDVPAEWLIVRGPEEEGRVAASLPQTPGSLDARVRDARGQLLTFFHGSPVDDIEDFEHGTTAYGIFFTPDRDTAAYYARGKSPRVYEVHLHIERLADLDDPEVFMKLAREGLDYSETRSDEAARRFGERLYNEGYGKNAVVTAYFDAIEGIAEVGEGYSAYDLLCDERVWASEIEDLVQDIDLPHVTAAFEEAVPLYSEELQGAQEAYGSQNFYLHYQNDMIRAAEALGYDGVVFTDPSSTGESVSYVVFRAEQVEQCAPPAPVPAEPSERQREAAFNTWFGQSVLRDGAGLPLVLYHGTHASFDAFDPYKQGSVSDAGWYGAGFYLTPDPLLAARFAEGEGGNLMPVYARIERPYYWHDHQERGLIQNYGPASQQKTAELKAAGFDGVIVAKDYYSFANGMSDESWGLLCEASPVMAMIGRERLASNLAGREYGYQSLVSQYGEAFVKSLTPSRTEITEVVAFEDTQIKSALGNDGSFDREDPSILSQATPLAPQDLRRWAEGTRAVDAAGLPLRVYHGSSEAIAAFDHTRTNDGLLWFSVSREKVEAGESGATSSAVITEAYLQMRNPAGWEEYERYTTDQLIQLGYDGIILDDDYVVFEGAQVWVVPADGPAPARDADQVLSQKAAAEPLFAEEPAPRQSRYDAWLQEQARAGRPVVHPVERAASFDRWFGASQVLTEEGQPRVMYHATRVWETEDGRALGDILAFDRMAAVKNLGRRPGLDTVGSWFSDTPSEKGAGKYGRGGAVYPVHLAIETPYVTTFADLQAKAHALAGTREGRVETAEPLRDWLAEQGYDGIRILPAGDGTDGGEFDHQDVWVALYPWQIKSAIGHAGLYDRNSDSILSQRAAQANTLEREQNFWAWFDGSAVVDPDGSPRVVYHGTDSVFEAFEHTSDIGFHFGTEVAARQRRARGGRGAVRFEAELVSAVEKDSLAAAEGTLGDSPAAELYALLLRKLDHPRPNLRDQVAALSAEERASALAEHETLPDSPRFAERVAKAQAGDQFVVLVNDKEVSRHPTARAAAARAARLARQVAQPMAVHLNIRNPLRMRDLGVWPAQEIAREAGFSADELRAVAEAGDADAQYAEVRRRLEAKGYDGIVYTNEVEHIGSESFIAFRPEQIKSAFDNDGSFDREDPSILSQSAALAPAAQREINFRRWFEGSPVVDERGEALVMYHGTKSADDLTRFIPGGPVGAEQTGDAYGVAAYFTSNPVEASAYGTDGAVLPVYIRGKILDVDLPELKAEDAARLTAFANEILLPSDKARFPMGRAERRFTEEELEDARAFFDTCRDNWDQFGDKMERAKPEADKDGDTFIVRYTDFDAPLAIRTGEDAWNLFKACGWDNLPAAGFEGVMLPRENGQKWVVMHRPEGNVKSAIGNVGAFNGFDPHILHQFAGERARTADRAALRDAKVLVDAGAAAEPVRQQTGWFQGADSQWRFEIDDSQARLRPDGLALLNQAKHGARDVAQVGYRWREDGRVDVDLIPENFQYVSDIVSLQGMPVEKLERMLPADVMAAMARGEGVDPWEGEDPDNVSLRFDASFRFEGFDAVPLGDLLEHDALFAAYPALANVLVTVNRAEPMSSAMAVSEEGVPHLRIGLFAQVDPKEFIRAVQHEVQHLVQGLEGFARGADHGEAGLALAKSLRRTELEGRHAAAAPGDDLGRIERELADLDNMPSFEAYRRSAGEVEARNVEKRLGLSAEERRQTAPERTADMPWADTIKHMIGAPAVVERGQIRFGRSLAFEVALFEQANASTFIHESGHAYLEILRDMAERSQALDSQLRKDWLTLQRWLRIEGLAPTRKIPVEAHEKFARGWEAYMRDGQAPSADLEGVFQRFAEWLKAIYECIKSLFVRLTPEVVEVMDRMLEAGISPEPAKAAPLKPEVPEQPDDLALRDALENESRLEV
ncbi:ADP-ribosyltransferase-containing protein [Geopseudomonas aromaticivorans]